LPGENAPPEMDLFVYVPEPAPTIRRDKLERWLKLIYRDVYGCSADDRRIAIMLDGVSDPIELVWRISGNFRSTPHYRTTASLEVPDDLLSDVTRRFAVDIGHGALLVFVTSLHEREP